MSITTVSHALNDKGRVDPATRAHVMQVVGRLGYRANRHARGLRSGRSGTLALLLPVQADVRTDEALSLDFYMRLATTAAAAAFAQEQALILLPPAIVQTGLRGLAVDGGIVVDPSPLDARVDPAGRPGTAGGDDRAGSRPARRPVVRRLGDGREHPAGPGSPGHAGARRRIALLMPQTDWGWARGDPGAPTTRGPREHGAPRLIVPVAMQSGEENAFAGHPAAARRRPGPPDAVFVVAARFVRGVLRAAKEAGCQVPGAAADRGEAWTASTPARATRPSPRWTCTRTGRPRWRWICVALMKTIAQIGPAALPVGCRETPRSRPAAAPRSGHLGPAGPRPRPPRR